MPIGASKVGVLGAGLVPGGSVTFNASGTWDVPPGVKVVSITGKGGTGNPGNAGNQGNPGNPGTGAGGGSSGTTVTAPNGPCQNTSFYGGYGGNAFKRAAFPPCASGLQMWVCNTPFNTVNTNCLPKYTLGGRRFPNATPPNSLPSTPGEAGQGGQSGNAGTAGNPGNPGNPGCSSSALCNTFPGGAGGNAGAGGAAGNGGQGGQAGQGGVAASSGGSGGNGGGSGSNGGTIPKQSFAPPGNSTQFWISSFGGGGAGVTNSGGNPLANSAVFCSGQSYNSTNQAIMAKGGTGSLTRPNILPAPNIFVNSSQGQWTNIQGGQGGTRWRYSGCNNPDGRSAGMYNCRNDIGPPIAGSNNQIYYLGQYNPGPQAPELVRTGGGGGAAGAAFNASQIRNDGGYQVSGGGGGGGRGFVGNAGGPTPTPTGAAATPVTFNCVPVTPGTPTPITVASPGGQVVISWNPQ